MIDTAHIPHSRPDLGPREADAARDAVASGDVAQGRQAEAFEAEMAAAVGVGFGVAVSSGTAALHLVLQVLRRQGGETRRVLMPSYVCGALVHAARASGAEPELVDVDGDTGNVDAAPATCRCDVAIVPHMFGRPAQAVAALAARLPVVEDLAMALGTVGVGTTGAAAVCSFYATKVITAGGEGGMVLTDDEALAEGVRDLREYDGRGVDTQRWNYKLTDVAAAVGRVQLARLPELLNRRRELALRYDEALAGLPARRPPRLQGENEFRYVLVLDEAGTDIDHAIAQLERLGVAARRPVPEPLHRALGRADADFPGSERMWRRALSLPLYPSLTDREAGRVVDAARHVLAADLAAIPGRG